MLSPDLESARLILKPFSEPFISDTYIGWLKNPEVVRYSQHRNVDHDYKSCLAFLQSMRDSGNIFSAILLKRPPQHLRHVGNIVAYFDLPNKTADMAMLIGEKDVWGQGIGTEAWTCLMNHLLTDRGMRKVTAGTAEPNHAMLGIMRQSGMHEEGRRRRQHIVDGKEVDLIYYARFRD